MPLDLPAWLRLLEQRHPRSIELGLGRCGRVRDRLGWHRLPFALLIVSGTNGKGSAVALLEACLRAAGYRTGAYTSPHLHRYNERVRVDGEAVTDADLCAAFEQVEAARGDTPLTYFETGTLGAMAVFLKAAPDVVILEVGLGGRLDAVNMFDGDGALMTSVDLDHRDWLGDDVRIIGREKAGVFRAQRPAVCADPLAPDTVAATAATIGAHFLLAGRDYRWERTGDSWWWRGDGLILEHLPLPALPGEHQLRNAAGAIALLHAVGGPWPCRPGPSTTACHGSAWKGAWNCGPGPCVGFTMWPTIPRPPAPWRPSSRAIPVKGATLPSSPCSGTRTSRPRWPPWPPSWMAGGCPSWITRGPFRWRSSRAWWPRPVRGRR